MWRDGANKKNKTDPFGLSLAWSGLVEGSKPDDAVPAFDKLRPNGLGDNKLKPNGLGKGKLWLKPNGLGNDKLRLKSNGLGRGKLGSIRLWVGWQ